MSSEPQSQTQTQTPQVEGKEIPISPKIVILGFKSLDANLGACLEKKYENQLLTHWHLYDKDLKLRVLECLEETGFFKDKEDAIKQLVEEAREVFADKEEATIENFKKEVADYIVSFGMTPKEAYQHVYDDWVEDIEGDDEDEWWEDEEEEEDDGWWEDEDDYLEDEEEW